MYFHTDDVTTADTTLYALAAQDGTEEWKIRVPSARTSWLPAVANGVVHLTTGDTLYAYDAVQGLRNGKPLLTWQYLYGGSAQSFKGPPVVANGFVYVTMVISGSGVSVALALPTWPYKH